MDKQQPATTPTFFSEQKLLKHLDRLLEWQTTGHTAPIQIGIDITNVCNHNCPGCNGAPGLLEDHNSTIPFEVLENLTREWAEMGVKAVSFGGGGDATCHPRFADILRMMKSYGMELAVFTNAQLMRENVIDAVIDCCTWIRISLDADGPEMYNATHGMKPRDWDKVLENVRAMVAARAAKKSAINIGTSFLIGSHTYKGIYGVSALSKELGVDYVRLRPFFTWNGRLPFSQEEAEAVVQELARTKAELSAPGFVVSFPALRTEWVKEAVPPANYTKCNIHHFVTQIAADQKMYVCCHTKHGFDQYCLGNLKEKTFKEIWESDERKRVYNSIDFKDCAQPCMLSAHNELLHSIESPVPHQNFL